MKRFLIVLVVAVLFCFAFTKINCFSSSIALFNWFDGLFPNTSGDEFNQPNNVNAQPNQPQRPDLRHLEPIEISIRDLIAEAGQYHSRRVIVGPLRIFMNDVERQSFFASEVTGVSWGFFSTSSVDIEVFYRNMSDASTTWRYYDGSTSEAIMVEGTFYLYKDENNKGAIYADRISIIQADEYNE